MLRAYSQLCAQVSFLMRLQGRQTVLGFDLDQSELLNVNQCFSPEILQSQSV